MNWQRPNNEVTTTSPPPVKAPNPKRVSAGRLNRMKRKGLTPEGCERLRQSALRNQPWRFSTGPRTPAGKAKVALNGKGRQQGLLSIRQIRAEVADLRAVVREMRDGRTLAGCGAAFI